MSAAGMAAPSFEQEEGSLGSQTASVACGYCLRRLSKEFFFTCLKCKASYCYIHSSRHRPAACSREIRRKSSVEATGHDGRKAMPRFAAGEAALVPALPQQRLAPSANV
jgi:hypothetical protein